MSITLHCKNINIFNIFKNLFSLPNSIGKLETKFSWPPKRNPVFQKEAKKVMAANGGLQVMNVAGPCFLLMHHTWKLLVF